MSEFLWTMYEIFMSNRENFLRGTLNTLIIAITGTFIGLIIGLLVGIVRTTPRPKNMLPRLLDSFIKWLLSAYISVFRGTPMIVQAMVIFFGTSIVTGVDLTSLQAALIVVSINTGAYMSEAVRGGIISVDDGQYEAAQAIGMSHWQIMGQIVMPQAFRNILPSIGNEFVVNIKDTSVLNVISMNELYFTTNTIAGQNFRFFETFFVTALIYYILTFIVTQIIRWIEHRMEGDSSYILVTGNTQQMAHLNEEAGAKA